MLGVIDASPLIFLGKIGGLNLVPQMFNQVFTTTIVKQEVLGGEEVPERPVLEEAFESWLEIADPQETPFMEKLQHLHLHRGEISVLALARELKLEKKYTIEIIDDLAAREVARTLGIEVTGTIGILLRGVKMNLITKGECKQFLRNIIEETDFRMSIQLYSRILTQLDEID